MSAEILEIGILNSNSSHRQQQQQQLHHGSIGTGTNSSSSPQRRLMCFFILFMISIFYFMVYGFTALSPWEKFDRQVIRSSSSSSNTELLQQPKIVSSSTASGGGAAANNREAGLSISEKHDGRKAPLSLSSSTSSSSLSRSDVVSLEEILDNFTSMKCSSSSNHDHHQLFLNRDLAFTSPQFHQWLPHPNPIYQNSPEYHTLKKKMEEEEDEKNGGERDGKNHNNSSNIIRNNEMMNKKTSTTKDESKTTSDDIVVPPEFYAPVIDWKMRTTKRKKDSSLDEKEEIRKFLLKNIDTEDYSSSSSTENRENCKVLFNQLVDNLVDDLLSKFQKRRMNFEKSQREQFHRARKGDSPPSTTYWHQESRKELWQCLLNKNKNKNSKKNADEDKNHQHHDQLDEDETGDEEQDDDEFRFLFIGNSNTRTLMTNIQARLEGNTRQMSRVKAKQLCDNRARNHSCFVKVVANKEDFFVNEETHDRQKKQQQQRRRQGEGGGKFTIHLDYIGYTEDWYHPSLKTRIDAVYEPRSRSSSSHRRPGGGANEHRRSTPRLLPVDLVVMNTGINTIQTNANWMGNNNKYRQRKMVDLRHWLEKQWGIIGSSSSSSDDKNNNNKKSHHHHHHQSNQKSNNPHHHLLHFFWHSTTPLCPNMPHFRRYRFRKSKWSGQSAETVSEGTRLMNDQIKKWLPWGMGTRTKRSKTDGGGGGGYFLSYIESSPASLTTLTSSSTHHQRTTTNDINNVADDGLLDGVQRDDRTKILVAAGSGSRMINTANNLTLSSSTPYYPASMFGKSIPNHNINKPSSSSASSSSSLPPKYCYYYEDPLHHRFLDRVIVDVMLSQLGC